MGPRRLALRRERQYDHRQCFVRRDEEREVEGQCIWRYNPRSKVFEIYAEGGGNTFSLDIDSKGRVFSGTNAGNRGMHYEQGSYGVKGWGKHGPLTNPYAFGYFEHMAHEGDNRRFSQAYAIYEGGLLGSAYEGRIIAPNSLHNLVYVSERIPVGSDFRTKDEANLVTTPDRWFRPVCAGVGPDGGFYMGDWYDTRLSHVSPIDDWDKSNGRIYRIRPASGAPKLKPFDLHKASGDELIGLLSHQNEWFRKQAANEIGWCGMKELLPRLIEMAKNNDEQARARGAVGRRHARWRERRARGGSIVAQRRLCSPLGRAHHRRQGESVG